MALSCVVGLVAIHASVNVFNDYFDFKSGIDVITKATLFSGGSRVLPEGLMTSNQVLVEGLILLCIGLSFGFYVLYATDFSVTIILLIAFAIACSVGYSPIFANKGIGEAMAFLGLGPAPTIGTYFAITRVLDLNPLLLGIIAGAMGSAVLYVNEFPDFDADQAKGRLNLVIRMGKARASKYLKAFFVLAYITALVMMLLQIAPLTLVITFVTIPWTAKASGVLERNFEKVENHLSSNALTIKAAVSTGYLLAAGYAVSVLIHL